MTSSPMTLRLLGGISSGEKGKGMEISGKNIKLQGTLYTSVVYVQVEEANLVRTCEFCSVYMNAVIAVIVHQGCGCCCFLLTFMFHFSFFFNQLAEVCLFEVCIILSTVYPDIRLSGQPDIWQIKPKKARYPVLP